MDARPRRARGYHRAHADGEREFVIGGHKAAAVAMTMQHAEVVIVSALPADDMRSIGFRPFRDLAQALRYALSRFDSPRVAVKPEGGSVVPCVARPCF